MNRETFFAYARANPFGGALNQSQVDGTTSILAEWDHRNLTDLRWLAYLLATTFHETARTMQPIHERGPKSYFDKYDGRKSLGNTVKGDGYRYRGRGLAQITGKTNYLRASNAIGIDFLSSPDKVLEPRYAAPILFDGMIDGWFTGKKLSDYFHDGTADWRNARRIVNGIDKADTIAKYGQAFYAALLAAAGKPAESRPDIPAPKPVPTPPSPPASPATGFFALILSILKALFGKR